MSSDHPATSARRFFEIAEALCWAVGKAIRPGFISAVLAMIVVRRIHRVRGALLALEARFLAGRILRRAARVGAAGKMAVARKARVAVLRIPSRFAWLYPLVPSDAACYAGHFRLVLAEPGMRALLAACPQAVRALGPLCRMLGIERAEYVPAGSDAAGPAKAQVRVRKPRKPRREPLDLEAEDAHYAFTNVPRRFRMRVG